MYSRVLTRLGMLVSVVLIVICRWISDVVLGQIISGALSKVFSVKGNVSPLNCGASSYFLSG